MKACLGRDIRVTLVLEPTNLRNSRTGKYLRSHRGG
jgi:hypothetical protein